MTACPPLILYDYQPGRAGEYAKNSLEGFSGLLECDGYTGYNSVENVILVCCSAHCRRYFFEAVPAARRKKVKLWDIHSPEEAADLEKAKRGKGFQRKSGFAIATSFFG